jgi:hypothetical protein
MNKERVREGREKKKGEEGRKARETGNSRDPFL